MKQDLAADDSPVLSHEVHDGERDSRFAATGFADDAVRLARHQSQIEINDCGDLAGSREIRDAEVATFEDRRLLAYHGNPFSL
jgi:hypothetical protein